MELRLYTTIKWIKFALFFTITAHFFTPTNLKLNYMHFAKITGRESSSLCCVKWGADYLEPLDTAGHFFKGDHVRFRSHSI